MQSGTGKLPPLKPVPEPRVTTGFFSRFAHRRIAATCSVVFPNTTQPGICRKAAVPSNEYGIKSSGLVSKFSGPTMVSNSENALRLMLWPFGCLNSLSQLLRRIGPYLSQRRMVMRHGRQFLDGHVFVHRRD